mgnify:FL=1
MESLQETTASGAEVTIGEYTFDEYIELATRFHGYAAPGLIVGGFMVEQAKTRIPEGVLYDAISETSWCLPDAVQMLTPCKIGNGWLKVFNLGVYAVSLYDKFSGKGVRVYLDVSKLVPWPEIKAWYMKLKPKREQDSELLREQLRDAGIQICSMEDIRVHDRHLKKRSKGKLGVCSLCSEAYPLKYGGICRSCQGESPYIERSGAVAKTPAFERTDVGAVPVEEAVGSKLLHDMTRIVPGRSKGAAFRAGQEVTAGDVCRLQRMGRNRVYLEPASDDNPDWVHENKAAEAFGRAMAGEAVAIEGEPSEGKVNLVAEQDGLLLVNEEVLERFNMLPGVMCASKQSYGVVTAGTRVAGTRAIPLYLDRRIFDAAAEVLEDGPVFDVKTMRKAKVGILVTGTEIFNGLVEDKFGDVITRKVKPLGCTVVDKLIVPDETEAVKQGVVELIEQESDLIVTTAGLSVDPEDVTRQGLVEAGAESMLYGAPILPGAMMLLARIGTVQVFGVPACALFCKTTSFDLLLPRLLTGLEITRSELAKMGHGAMCNECKNCTYPKCTFGR